MNHRKAQTIYRLIKSACKKDGIPFTKAGYRRAKKAYNLLPWNRRHLVTGSI